MNKDDLKDILRHVGRFLRKEIEPISKGLSEIRAGQQQFVSKDQLAALEKSFNENVVEKFSKPMEWIPKELLPQGAPGRDADPVALSDVAAELLQTDGLKSLIDLMVSEAVAKHFEDNPVQPGKDGADGRDGKDGAKGEVGEKGATGADGVGLAGAMINREGELIVTKTNGEAIPLGVILGKDGQPGKDGADFTDLELEYDGERGLIIRGKGGELVKRLPIPIDRGYWREGMKAEKSDVMTQDGSVWIALKDTSAKPCRENDQDWRLMVRKGRDGLQGPAGKDYKPPEPVKLNG